MNLNIRDLKFFYIIAEEGSLGQASERIGRSQPALSKCIQRLEDEVGTPLLARSGHGVTLTAAGKSCGREPESCASLWIKPSRI